MNKNDPGLYPTVVLEDVWSSEAKGITDDGIKWFISMISTEYYPRHHIRNCVIFIGCRRRVDVREDRRKATFAVYGTVQEASRIATTLLHEELRLHRKAGQKDSSW